MGRCYFDDTGTKLRVNKAVSNNPQLHRSDQILNIYFFANVLLIALVVRVDSYGGIADLGFWSNRRDYKWPVLDVVQRIFLVTVANFNIREARVAGGAPVYSTVTSVNIAVIK